MIPIFQGLETLRDGVLWVSLSGAAGTGSEFGPEAATLRANFAKALNLRDPEYSWHADRGPIQRLTAWLLQLSQSLGKIGEDITLMMQSGLGEVTLGATGGSSTMPQKQNPVHPSALVALTHHARGAGTALQSAAMPRQARDGAAWFTEWLSLPSLCLAVASQLELTSQVLAGLAPNTSALASPLNDPLGLIHAEALTFQLANDMPRPEAQDIVKALCKTAQDQQAHLISLAAQAHGIDPAQFAPENQMGHAPQEARSFAKRARLAVNGT
jgi:3-carboxy-cis,cis-muconate cycloisomerase